MKALSEVAAKVQEGMGREDAPAPTKGEACPHCGGTGWRRREEPAPLGHPEFGKLVRCDCEPARLQRRARIQRRVERFSMPIAARYTFKEFDLDWHEDVIYAYQMARGFAVRPRGCLILWSPAKYGNGKSHLLMAAVRHLWQAGREAVAFSTPDFLEWLRSAYAGEESIAELLTVAKEVEVLALDDLGVENTKPWVREKLFQVVDYRYRNDMPLLISSNVNPRLMAYPRLASRLGDVAWAARVKIDAPDYRRRKEHRRG